METDKWGEWLIYGANGYTGELIAREARKRGMTPILAGRSQESVASLAGELGLARLVLLPRALIDLSISIRPATVANTIVTRI